ncbi:type II secretion system protein J [Deinococcus yunweiensis]|uniref:PulJ/GspJ family protein n=1 Tax=Deinococcus yunweiensis TaxID=367282 RepID=UPI00398E7F44
MTGFSSSTQGFTLVEMLVAISLLAIIMVATAGALPGLTRVNQTSSQEQRAVLLMRAAFEQARQQLEADFDRATLSVTLTGNDEGDVACGTPSMTTLRSSILGTSPTPRPMLIQVGITCRLGTGSTAPTRTYRVDIARPI